MGNLVAASGAGNVGAFPARRVSATRTVQGPTRAAADVGLRQSMGRLTKE
jgi:hypothetical protein